jgi:hypothetical protein
MVDRLIKANQVVPKAFVAHTEALAGLCYFRLGITIVTITTIACTGGVSARYDDYASLHCPVFASNLLRHFGLIRFVDRRTRDLAGHAILCRATLPDCELYWRDTKQKRTEKMMVFHPIALHMLNTSCHALTANYHQLQLFF